MASLFPKAERFPGYREWVRKITTALSAGKALASVPSIPPWPKAEGSAPAFSGVSTNHPYPYSALPLLNPWGASASSTVSVEIRAVPS